MGSKVIYNNASLQEHTMLLRDGHELFFRAWKPSHKSTQALLIFHRGHEHSGRLMNVISELDLNDTWVFAWDARGHGKTGGQPESFDQLVDDMDEFVRHVSEHFGIALENMAIVAHSYSAVAASAWVQRNSPEIASLILLAPAFKINLMVPCAYGMLKALALISPDAQIPSYVSGRMLTRCAEEARHYDNDSSISRQIPLKVLLGLRQASDDLIRLAHEIAVPTLLLIPEQDFVVCRKEQTQFFANLSSDKKQLHVYPGMRHDMLHDLGREEPLQALHAFALENIQSHKLVH